MVGFSECPLPRSISSYEKVVRGSGQVDVEEHSDCRYSCLPDPLFVNFVCLIVYAYLLL